MRDKPKGWDLYQVHVLFTEQNGHNPAKKAHFNVLYLGKNIIGDGCVLGLGVSQSFGNGALERSHETQTTLSQKPLADDPTENIKIPLYLMAEPEVTTMVVEPGEFIILGSTGLWSMLTNEEIVGLVGWWLDRKGEYQVGDDVAGFGKW
jgi:pyruvate dehydrogenase phosphatase